MAAVLSSPKCVKEFESTHSCFLIQVILPAMRAHPKDLGVQMAATACLYNLSKGDLGSKIHPSWLGRIVALTMDAMLHFPNHQQLQKNALLTLCSDRILQDVVGG